MNKNFHSIIFVLLLCGFVFGQESKPLRILEKPNPKLPENHGTLDEQGSITLRVEFLANGQIGKVIPVSSLPYLIEYAIEAAKKIKFQPEVKNGNSVTIFKQIQYSYTYGGWMDSFNQIESSKNTDSKTDEKAEAIIKKAVANLGGEKYLQAKSQIGRGKFSVLREGAMLSFQTFVDVIVFPDKERTEFKNGGSKTVQTNTGETGWIFDGDAQTINVQNKEQIENFRRSVRTSLDNLLRGGWRKENAALSYIGKRQASLGKRNDVVKLTFADGFAVEFEFSAEGMPMKSIYKRKNPDNEDVTEEDRYAQFVNVLGIKTPFIIDHFSNNQHASRVNYETVEFNKSVPDSIFAKPNSAKELKKDLKL
jgi:hypothetical protein